MAYSDYGGYAFRNGKRIEDRSDCTIKPDGDLFGTPGIYPGFAMLAEGVEHAEVVKAVQWPHGHAVLGDGPIHVVLYKQTTIQIFRGPERLSECDLLVGDSFAGIKEWQTESGVRRYIDWEYFVKHDMRCVFSVDGFTIEVRWIDEDNIYQFVRMEQSDGNVWHGWSGYGVGAGLEDAGYGYSTEEQNQRLLSFWPDSIS
jgi:hypothetical protein